jgi:hypothetical protein
MGVGFDMAGKPVRCPHCRQVVTAPAPAGRAVGGPPDTPSQHRVKHTPPEAAAPAPSDYPMPKSPRPPRPEGAESIFGEPEHDEDSLFSSQPPRPQLRPELPEPSSGKIDFPARPESGPEGMQSTDELKAGDVVRPILGPPTPFIKKDLSQPDFALFPKADAPSVAPPPPPPPPVFPPPAKPEEAANPWAKLPPADLPLSASSASGKKLGFPPEPSRRGRLFWVLVGYAVLMTVLAAWGWLLGRPHPLSVVPDFFGQYRQAERKKVSALPVDANQPIPAALRVKLGQRLAVGDLEFEPVAVEERKTEWKGDGDWKRHLECLVLTVRVRNRSAGVSFHPLDPAYNRYATVAGEPPLTGVVVGGERFPGGPIPWPFVQGREFVLGQEQDDAPLEPGQERTTVIPAIDGEKGKKLMQLVRAATGPVLWQVHVRRGLIEYRGEDVSVGAVIGVEFDAGQVKH